MLKDLQGALEQQRISLEALHRRPRFLAMQTTREASGLMVRQSELSEVRSLVIVVLMPGKGRPCKSVEA